jgi:hypothetical protein
LTLPTRTLPEAPDADEHAAQLISFTRHGFPEMAASIATAIRRHGRGYAFEILRKLALPIVIYYQTMDERPLSPYEFAPGSAEHFAYGYVAALLAGDEDAGVYYVDEFRGSCESELERAMSLMTSAASHCLNILALIQDVESSIRPF